MRTRIIDNNNDFTFGMQEGGYATKAKSIELDIKLALQEWYNDCFFNLNAGIFWQVRLGYHNQQELLDNDIKELVLNRYGVLSISDFNSAVFNRIYRCTFTVSHIYSKDNLYIPYEMSL